MKVQYTRAAKLDITRGNISVEPGYIHEHKDAFRLVQIGMAIPADDECRERCGLTDDEIWDIQRRYNATYARIHPEDQKLFDAGVIAGYTADGTGNYEPGPNASNRPDIFPSNVRESLIVDGSGNSILVDDDDVTYPR